MKNLEHLKIQLNDIRQEKLKDILLNQEPHILIKEKNLLNISVD